jgi:hypothetical protein
MSAFGPTLHPSRPSPATPLLALCGEIRDCVKDLESQAAEGGRDRTEVVRKLDGLQAALIEGREDYLQALQAGGLS